MYRLIIISLCFLILSPFGDVLSQSKTHNSIQIISEALDEQVTTENNPPANINLPDLIAPPISMGQPSRHRIQLGMLSGYSWEEDNVVNRLYLSDHTVLSVPQMGGVNVTVETGLQVGKNTIGGTATLYATLFGLQNGVEYDTRRNKFLYRLAVDIVAKRGGLSGFGNRLRLEYVPGTKTVHVGLTINSPWKRYRHNRPRLSYVRLTRNKSSHKPVIPESQFLRELLGQIQQSLKRIDELLTPRLVYDIDSHRQVKKFNRNVEVLQELTSGNGNGFLAEDSIYHKTLRDVFTFISEGDEKTGNKLAELSEIAILEDLVVPFNRLFGQRKRPFDLCQFKTAAMKRFESSISNIFSEQNTDKQDAAMMIFEHTITAIQKVAERHNDRWDEARLVWLPLNYGLQPEQYDSQEEVEQIVGLVTGRTISNANSIQYLHNDRYYHELENMVRETEYYHVLHIHDVCGKRIGITDEISWRFAINGYIESFINAIEEIDSGERKLLPQFMIFLDQFYYEKNKSKTVISFLEKLYEPGKLKIDDDSLKDQVKQAHYRLRKAIENSSTFSTKPDSTLKKLFRVHINITNTFDPVYSEDAIARDHRKLTFRDVFEDDPAMGVAIFTGMGVGSLYVGSCWDDRSLMVRGSELVHLKDETRLLFLSQGYDPDEIPYYLQPRQFPTDYKQRCEKLRNSGWTTSLMHLMNFTGYGSKQATIIKAVMYNLALPGSVLVIPDSIWASDYWASMLFAASLRGCHVYAIAPDRAHAPSSAGITLETIRKTLKSLLKLSNEFAEEIDKSGGTLKIGFYRRNSDVFDIKLRLEEFLTGIQNDSTYADLNLIQPSFIESIEEELRKPEMSEIQISHLISSQSDCYPKLHFKMQYFMNKSALSVLGKEEWADIIHSYFDIRRKEVTSSSVVRPGLTPNIVKPLLVHLDGDEYYKPKDPIFTMLIGSHNQDRRSMILDGEAIVMISGYESLIGFIDFALLMGSTDWINDFETIDKEFPRQAGIIRAVIRLIKNLI